MSTASQIQALIILEVGDTDSGLLAAQMATVWASYADLASVAPRLQELYTKRRCIDLVLGSLRQQVDFTTPSLTVKQDQLSAHLTAMRAEVQTEIARIEQRTRGNRAGYATPITTTAPVTPAFEPDANASRYAGSPYSPVVKR